ncbi:uncharacterized protein HMPREF1541_06440 [Cyphellophora europaea CBS 101466]|uniref:1-phosphatidylinositol-3-phosphate 5-kinase n=1 Tax=Cyphellophora europaea (strain CBS 101466) TaxID=1220924 RepID=W2RQ39_CYPE1|nr:uncharacterized protein HMPREF1541_06440 [Cyphellophora europaea CBS 101466]ETN38405.1 hypothetical protein HMPREF1541_06440 [Cyphellophora europaea CBS 101466]
MATAPQEPPSPSASSVFLPLGRRTRRDSKASITPDLDQDALNEALNTIHSAASQSQVLTVFNEYTEPPSSASKGENKTLTGDLQGGLSGLYNKLKATVGVSKEQESRDVSSTSGPSLERPTSKTSSNKFSTIHSPRGQFHDEAESPELQAMHATKISSKATSISKVSVHSPSIRSPTSPAPPAHVDPMLTSMTIYADKGPTVSHSRSGSTFEQAEDLAPNSPRAQEADGSASMVRETRKETVDRVPHEPRVQSPMHVPSMPMNAGAVVSNSHMRTLSEASTDARVLAAPASPIIVQDDRPVHRPSEGRQERLVSKSQNAKASPLHLLGTHAERSKSPAAVKATLNHDGAQPTITLSQSGSQHTARVPQSRLPGFATSQASSTDSGPTRSSQLGGEGRLDGTPEEHNAEHFTRPVNKLRSKLLNREFWMRDENARDCFHCGEPFTTFRRKHHCRTCGQIFDNKCTVAVSGAHFAMSGPVRVCKPCEAIILSHDDDSSDFSDVESIAIPESLTRPRTPDTAQLLRSAHRFDDDNISIKSSLEHMAKTPTMNFPVRRAYEGDGSSKVLEFDSLDRVLPRPSSSRSLKHNHSIGHGHKRHHSRHQHIRSYKAYHDERAPFQRRTLEDISKDPKMFHRDSIIDPDLAQYLSDDASSGDEQSIIGPEKLSRSVGDGEKGAMAGLLAAVRKGRSRMGDRNIGGFLNLNRDSDDVSIISARDRDAVRPSRRRNLSVASSIHQRATPRTTKERLHIALNGGSAGDDTPSTPIQPQQFARVNRMIRSASMHGLGAPAMELNRASIQHVHKLLQQLLRDAEMPKTSSWEEALVPILLRATDDVDPDVAAGDDIDIRNYVKLKKVPGGRPGDTSYISGLIFTKNVALKSMRRLIMSPRILIITFALEYARHEQHFMSLDPVIRQEREYLENLIGRIATLKPDVLLAQRNVSGLALELLNESRIATIFNVKPSVLEAVSRCTRTRIVHSIDKLSTSSGQLGTCESFEVKTFVAEGRKKNYIYLSGCPPQLGCTIAIRGADRKMLSKIKRITEFMVYVVYNLKLETCLMRDEWAMIPNSHSEKDVKHSAKTSIGAPVQNDTSVRQPQEHLTSAQEGSFNANVITSSQSAEGDLKRSSAAPALSFDNPESADIPDDVPVPMFYEDMVEKHQTRILSASPFVKFMQPYLLMKARELERRVAYLKRLRDQDMTEEQSLDEKSKAQKFVLIQPDMLHAPLAGASKKVREIIHAVHDSEYDKALHNYETQKRQWETYLSGNRNLFDPYAHQNIVVLFSLVATATSVPCTGPELLAFNFYGEHVHDDFEADCTLGQYVEGLCVDAKEACASSSCDKKMYEHHRQYVHGEAQISVFVQPYPAKMRGLEEVILMWSQCKICGIETTVTPMSASTWKYSFGKYLELSFWSADLHARAGMCPHDLHRDHLRFFGYKDYALRIHYDPIDLLEIIVPRLRVTWKVDNDLRFRNEVFTRIEHRITRFMGSVKLRLKSINAEAILPENGDACKEEIEKLTKKANEDHTMLIKQLQERYSNSRHWEIIPLNRAIRTTQEKVAEWDLAFAEFEQNFLPSEKDIRRLATLQLKKIFLDRDVSITSLTSDHEGAITPPVEEVFDEKDEIKSSDDRPLMRKRTTTLSPEKTQTVLQSILEAHASPPQAEKSLSNFDSDASNTTLPNVYDGPRGPEDMKHLDLAVPSNGESSPASPGIVSSIGNISTPPLQQLNFGSANSEEPKTPRPDRAIQAPVSPMATPRANADKTLAPPQRSASIKTSTPPLLRALSTPAGSVLTRKDMPPNARTASPLNFSNESGSDRDKSREQQNPPANDDNPPEKKLSERFGLTKLKHKGQSFIPRAISSKKDSRVSNLAKHFEQLSREFERERVRERKLRAARTRQSRVYPLAAPKPIVEVYKDVDEAVDEPHDIGIFDLDRSPPEDETAPVAQGHQETDPSQTDDKGSHADDTHTEATETEGELQLSSHAPSDVEDQSDLEDDGEQIFLPDSPEDLLRLSQEDLEFKELPKHERKSLMQMLTTFWAERSSSGWAPLEYPMGASEHVFADCDIVVREDEPSSIIAFALNSDDYQEKLHDLQTREFPPESEEIFGHRHLDGDSQADVMHSLLRRDGTHLKYQFAEGPAKMLCKIFFAEQFDAVRRKCGVQERIVESLSRCLKWDSKGGKTKSLFLKTLDDRFVLKSLSPIETQSFLKFAPNYFQIMSEAFFHELPSVIAKMLGFYQIIIKNTATGVEYNWYLLLMENLFYDRSPTRIFDLKGSMRNRKINATGERNEVLLDENMVEFIYESPLFAREHSKKLLRSSVHNDTLFLARQNVMDYSLMIAIDEVRKELVVGIIDCIRTYTWDKKLESWIKDRGFAGGGKNRPTVTSPKEYKRRFREAMGRYVLEAPNCWHQFKPVRFDKNSGGIKLEHSKDKDDGDAVEKADGGEGERIITLT